MSLALNSKGGVSETTAERVREIARDIGYTPNALARGLQRSSIGMIGLVIRPLDTLESFLPAGVDFFLRLTGAASLAALERGYTLMLVTDPSKPDSPLSALAADAYIVTEPHENDPVLTMLAGERIPFVTIDHDPARPDAFPAFRARATNQVQTMLAHLVEAGAQRVALVTGTDPNAWNIESRDEYLKWCAASGRSPQLLSYPETAGSAVGDDVIDALFGASPTLPLSSPAPDAIFCLTGRHAAGVTEAAIARGIRVPEDLLVAGGSGAIINQTSKPTVTTFDLQPEAVGALAVDAAVKLAERKPLEGPLESPPALIQVRESTTRSQH
ncbi:LacI family transcriptional regulator [Leucobacter komagatae]|uniref:LacI family transcriptional regulator n=1 Tax=Leucobacter komagatae TaxID=55969 RepID=A0A0D0H4T4_9MICO|nr:LacI family transcriptional regulator [Leucobacter komagatae]